MRASGVWSFVVDHVPAKRRELHSAGVLRRRGACLGELTGDAADLDDRKHPAVGQHCRHLQQDLQLVADKRRRELVERLGAVAGLEHERAPGGNLAERVAELPRLACEDERREPSEACAQLPPWRRPATRADGAPDMRARKRATTLPARATSPCSRA